MFKICANGLVYNTGKAAKHALEKESHESKSGVITMAAKIYPFKNRKEMKENGQYFALILSVVAWAAFIVGIILCLVRISDFNDRNMYLMAGIGCIVGSVFIYCIGAFLAATMNKKYRKANDDVGSRRK